MISYSASDIAIRTVERRAIEAAIWGMPIVSVDAMREAFFRDAGAKYNDIVFWSKPSDWKTQLTTPNSTSLYVYFNLNTREQPLILEVPPAGDLELFGTLMDAWQTPLVDVGPNGADQGSGAKYLILPPGFADPIPEGYITVTSETYNGYALLRIIPASTADADTAKAVELAKQVKLYPLSFACNPPPQRFLDMSGRLLDGIVTFDETFYARLARMINEEPVQTRDLVAMGQLRSLGIEKGKQYQPSPATLTALRMAAKEARVTFIRALLNGVRPWWSDLAWGLMSVLDLAVKTSFSFQTWSYLDIDARAPVYFLAFATPARLGEGSFFLVAYRDAEGDLLEGSSTYRLHIPSGVPVERFWAITVYDLETAAFIRESPRVGVDSFDRSVKRNIDGSINLVFGPRTPTGDRPNWIYTRPNGRWFAMFRFHGPTRALLDKAWKACDFERIAR